MKRVCHLSSVHHRYDTRILLKECLSLHRQGYEVHLVVADGKGFENYQGIQIHDTGRANGRMARFLKATKAVYKKGLELNAEVYHFHDAELIPFGIKLKKQGKKVIYDSHEDLPRQLMSKHYINFLLRKPISVLLEWYEDYASKKFDFVITATPHIRQRFSKLNKNSLDINNYPLLSELNTEASDWSKKKNEVCYIGSITQIRGLEEVIDAMEYLPGIMLNLAGSFAPPSFKENLTARKGWLNTRYLGQIDRDEVKRVLRQSQVGLVTFLPFGNHTHSQPNKLFEYMAQGIPLVASDFELWKAIIEKVNCGICVDPGNSKAIAQAIELLMGDKAKAQQMGENGRSAVLNTYNWESEEKKLIQIYRELA
ncbi:glycosyltransferase family 4 protein [Pareuzebyella sediminis]|uniref:glycosyltransferase family 4 protein n=1 Tax=Pareuzebyella sediminis TaxID=2607998 RepID=UPI0011EC2461|nr:glycosyltransferase family 4 protein [Pareuzebyella sediminis]